MVGVSVRREKPLIGIDVDDTLLDMKDPLIATLAEKFGIYINPWDFATPDLKKTTGLSEEEIGDLVHYTYSRSDFAELQALPGSQDAIAALGEEYDFVAVTSRPEESRNLDIHEITLTNLKLRFPGNLERVLHSRTWDGNGDSKSKIEIAIEEGAVAIIDDFVHYLIHPRNKEVVKILVTQEWNYALPIENDHALFGGMFRMNHWSHYRNVFQRAGLEIDGNGYRDNGGK